MAAAQVAENHGDDHKEWSNDHKECPNQQKNIHKLFNKMAHPVVKSMETETQYDQKFPMEAKSL